MNIESLQLKTLNIKGQKNFYNKILGLEMVYEGDNFFEVKTGSSILKFKEDSSSTPYHVAFHIPPGEVELALSWVKHRVEIQKNDQEEIIDFSAWSAMSLYFYDADKNIIEFISRSDLYPRGKGGFSGKSILAIAEIGLATNDISEKFKILNEFCGLKKFDGNFENFCAIGNAEGLIITIDKNKKDWFPTSDKAYSSGFEMIFKQGEKRFKLIYEKDSLTITP